MLLLHEGDVVERALQRHREVELEQARRVEPAAREAQPERLHRVAAHLLTARLRVRVSYQLILTLTLTLTLTPTLTPTLTLTLTCRASVWLPVPSPGAATLGPVCSVSG